MAVILRRKKEKKNPNMFPALSFIPSRACVLFSAYIAENVSWVIEYIQR